MHKERKFYRGTIFSIIYFWDIKQRDSFVLAEYPEDDLLFPIICISEFHS